MKYEPARAARVGTRRQGRARVAVCGRGAQQRQAYGTRTESLLDVLLARQIAGREEVPVYAGAGRPLALLDTRNGFWLMTPLQTDAGPLVWVNRGWLPAGVDALSTPTLPEPPAW